METIIMDKKLIWALAIIIPVIFLLVYINLNKNVSEELNLNDIAIVTTREDLSLDFKIYTDENIEILNESLIILEENVINNEDVKKIIKNNFESGSIVGFSKNNLTKKVIEEYLDLNTENSYVLDDYPSIEYTRPLDDISTCIGWIVNKQNDGSVMFHEINSFMPNNDVENIELIARIMNEKDKKFFEENKEEKIYKNLTTYYWREVDSMIWSWIYPEGIVTMKGYIYTSPFNPMTHNKHHFFVKNNTQVIPNENDMVKFATKNVKLKVGGDGYGEILEDWSPRNSKLESDIKLFTHYGIENKYNVGTKINNTLVGGGFLEKYTLIEFTPRKFLFRVPTTKKLDLASSAYILQGEKNSYKYNEITYPNHYRGRIAVETTFVTKKWYGSRNSKTYNNYRVLKGY